MPLLLLRAVITWTAAAALVANAAAAGPDEAIEDTVARIKPSIVAVGTYQRTRAPAFEFRGTGFIVGDGTLVATNAHVLPASVNAATRESLAILIPGLPGKGATRQVELRLAREAASDAGHDLALLRIDGSPQPALAIGDSSAVREGRSVHFTGFPLGAVLGAYPVTHRAIVAAISPIAIPQRRDADLNSATIRRLAKGAFTMFQLDGIAYAGNSGSPVFDTDGKVIAVVNMVLVKSTKETLLAQPSGIAYAIPAEHLVTLLGSVR